MLIISGYTTGRDNARDEELVDPKNPLTPREIPLGEINPKLRWVKKSEDLRIVSVGAAFTERSYQDILDEHNEKAKSTRNHNLKIASGNITLDLLPNSNTLALKYKMKTEKFGISIFFKFRIVLKK